MSSTADGAGEKTLVQILEHRVRRFGEREFLRHKRDGEWQSISFRQFHEAACYTALGLVDLGVEPRDRVAILSENRPEWAVADFGCLLAGATSVPIYATNPPEQVEWILKDSGARAVLVSGDVQLRKVMKVRAVLPALGQVIVIDAVPPTREGDLPILSLAQLQERGRRAVAGGDPDAAERLAQRAEGVLEEDLATIIYTSGTTGNPKGVMLTHRNLVSNVKAARQVISITEGDTSLSFLPLSHVFERTVGYYLMLEAGATIAYAESVDAVPRNLTEVRPTVMCSVPRLYEKMHARIQEAIASAPAVRRKLFAWALGVGREVRAAQREGRELGALRRAEWAVADHLVFDKIRSRTGGRLRFFCSGGAPLAREIAEFFHVAGILILEGYGLSETAPILTVNRPEAFRFGTVGQSVPGVEVRIAPDGEILARGPNIMRGYFNNPEATAEAIDPEGWFHTGDIGVIEPDGFLRITDRKKDLLITSGGKNVAPQNIENLLKTDDLIAEVVAVGDRRNYIAALILPNYATAAAWAEHQGIAFANPLDLADEPRLSAELERRIHALSEGRLARYEQVKRFALLRESFTQEGGELTPTMKVKRKVVCKKYADLIEGLYAQPSAVQAPSH
ncbi:MAG: long-chain fatty acid--CoA ligase [Planctomycetes bacterium]|nr:long-chain fatty acid--CoA ligase [Planctomycetota bacterium]